jgi:hypothetical protein
VNAIFYGSTHAVFRPFANQGRPKSFEWNILQTTPLFQDLAGFDQDKSLVCL